MAERRYSDFPEIVAFQSIEQRAIYVIVAEQLGVLGESNSFKPTVNVHPLPP